jgi:hypothetical protein
MFGFGEDGFVLWACGRMSMSETLLICGFWKSNSGRVRCEKGSGSCFFGFYFFVGFGRPLYLGPNRLVSLFVFGRLVGGGLLVLLFWRRRWRGLGRGVGRRGGLVGAYILGGCC